MARKYYTKLKVEILGADLIIEDADMSVSFTKTDEEKPNYCDLVIYNVSEDTYRRINDKANSARIYADIDGQGYSLIFAGDLRNMVKWKEAKATSAKKIRKQTKIKKAVVHYNEPPIRREGEGDISTIISLQDGIKTGRLDVVISKSYRNAIKNTYVLDDILRTAKAKSSNIKIAAESNALKEYTYPAGLILHGNLLSVLKSVCNKGGAYCTMQNDTIVISSKSIDSANKTYAYLLNGENCPTPEASTDKELDIEAPFIPNLNPFNFVKLDFRDYQGLFQVKKVQSQIDNFGEDYETKITVKMDI